MGWGRMMLLGNVGQQLDISDLGQAVEQLRAENADVDQEQSRDIGRLRRENTELKLCMIVLVRLLVTKGVVQPREVEKIVKAMEV
jgi:hypothetical protein